jgi:hypothetical protein
MGYQTRDLPVCSVVPSWHLKYRARKMGVDLCVCCLTESVGLLLAFPWVQSSSSELESELRSEVK